MWVENCLNWEYKGHPKVSKVAAECEAILIELAQSPHLHYSSLGDTHSAHKRIFSSVAPVACPYLAGNYRGLVLGCLAGYSVKVGPHYGEPPNSVHTKMDDFHRELNVALGAADAVAAKVSNKDEKLRLLTHVVNLCATTLERFLTIHPYANGNGHIARLLVWILLLRYKFPPVSWTLDQSPPGYGDLIQQYRAGDQKPLKVFIYKSIIGD